MVPLMRSPLLIIIMIAQSNLSATQIRPLSRSNCLPILTKYRSKVVASTVSTDTIKPDILTLTRGSFEFKYIIARNQDKDTKVDIRDTTTLRVTLSKESKQFYWILTNILVKQPLWQDTKKILTRNTMITIIHDQEWNLSLLTKSPLIIKMITTKLIASQSRVLSCSPYSRT